MTRGVPFAIDKQLQIRLINHDLRIYNATHKQYEGLREWSN